ncbi:50S rRNA methyltransferase [Clostridiales bacterium PH28_bin88]|nr:50S rRNA methyltransferase [Clostridiales bacterium PH28_bin88]
MRIKLVAVGKIKERYLAAGVAEYLKRLQPFSRVEVVEVPDERLPGQPVPALEEAVKDKEGERLLAHVRDSSYTVALIPEGQMLSSEDLAALLDKLAVSGKSDLTFIIGGTLGLSQRVLQRADLLLSLSPMTFPHQMVRMILLEQLYRAFKISRGEPYHR